MKIIYCTQVKYISRIIFALLFLILSCHTVLAQNKSQLEQQKAQLELEIKRLNKELSSARNSTRLTTRQLNALNKKIKERTNLINNINSQMTLLNRQIGQTNDSIGVMRNQVDSMKAEYAKIIRVLYREHDNINKLGLLFDTPSYNHSYLRLKYFNEYSRYRKNQARFIKEREQQLLSVTQQLQRQRAEKSSLLAQEQKNKTQLTREQEQKRNSVNASKAQEKNLKAQLSKKEQQKRNLDKQIRRMVAEEVAKAARARVVVSNTTKTSSSGRASESTSESSNAAANAVAKADAVMSANFVENKGRFSWPVSYKSVIREYGRYTHASGGENMNNGIDLTTASGAAVYCIFKGTVSRVFTCPNGAKGVIVRHGDYMSVYANLATVSVKQGSKVSTKQVLGTVGDIDGHGEFSFQLWKGTTPQNPRSWLR